MKLWKWSKEDQLGWVYFILDGKSPLVRGLHKEMKYHADTGEISSGSPRSRHQDGINNAREFLKLPSSKLGQNTWPEPARAEGFILAHSSRGYSPSWQGKRDLRSGRLLVTLHLQSCSTKWTESQSTPERIHNFPNRATSSRPGVKILQPVRMILCSNYNSNLLVKIWGQMQKETVKPHIKN